MTKDEFIVNFCRLGESYNLRHTKPEIQSFLYELGNHDVRDFIEAIQRLPSNEPRSAVNPFPKASTIRNYILDAQETRRIQERRKDPKDVEDVYRRSLTQKRTDEQIAWARLFTDMIKVGCVTKEARELRIMYIERFIDDHGEWLGRRPEEREALQDTMIECSQ